jgi:alpha-N-arabinofuranosidase
MVKIYAPPVRRVCLGVSLVDVATKLFCGQVPVHIVVVLWCFLGSVGSAAESASVPNGGSASLSRTVIHVATNGSDANAGTKEKPFLTISAAAKIAQPGDVVEVHAGTYREWVKPPRGGVSDDQRIVYRAARGEKVYVKGSERITRWTSCGNGVWKTEVPNSIFGDYNPYGITVSGGWLEYGKWHTLGQVYLNGKGFIEVESSNELAATVSSWQGYINGAVTVISANFGEGVDPNVELAEINVRPCVFMPEVPGINYITVDGLALSQAANNWTPPTQKLQVGVIGPRMGKRWIIENCEILHGRSIAISLGNDADADHANIELFGDHLIRNNHIHHCGQGGIIGKHGATRSTISGNLIEDINYLKEFGGWESAGIKFHQSVDVDISQNVIRRVQTKFTCAGFGIWIDWGNQGVRISRNIVYDNDNYGIHLEMNHGPVLVDNNIVVGNTAAKAKGTEIGQYPGGINSSTDGVVYAHNLFVDAVTVYTDFPHRKSMYFLPHSKKEAGTREGTPREDRWINNLFIGKGLDNIPFLRFRQVDFKESELRVDLEEFRGAPGMQCDYNLYVGGAKPASFGDTHAVVDSTPADFKIESSAYGASVSFVVHDAFSKLQGPMVDGALAGVNTTTKQAFEDKNGVPIVVDSDVRGMKFQSPRPGPLANLKPGINQVTWSLSRRE